LSYEGDIYYLNMRFIKVNDESNLLKIKPHFQTVKIIN